MGRFTGLDAPDMDARVEAAIAGIGRDVAALDLPCLWGVVLGGGYGRGEGGVIETADGARRLSNDLDFFVIAKKGVPETEATATLGAALQPVSEKWTKSLGVDVDFSVKTPWRLKHDEARQMVQELLNGYVDVTGAPGAELFAHLVRRAPSELPWLEAARLMMNRGIGLLLAKEPGRTKDFVARNINKCILGADDAFLISRGLYQWRVADRVAALAAQGDDRLYRRAVEWKFRPREEPVCDWETARAVWQGAYQDAISNFFDEGHLRRTLRNAARWLVRRRTVGALATFGQDPVLRVLDGVKRCIDGRLPLTPALKRDWEIFN